MTPAEIERKKLEGVVQLRIVAQIDKDHVKEGRRCLHEHPLSAMSWAEECIKEIVALPGVDAGSRDQCTHGCKTAPTATTPSMIARESTRIIANISEMLGQLQRKCEGSHEHKQLRAKDLAKAAFYPANTIHSIIRGMSTAHAADIMKRAIKGRTRRAIPWLCGSDPWVRH